MIWTGLALLFLGVAIWPFWRESQLKHMNDAARQSAPGQFANLSKGQTHYTWHGPKDGPVAVCIHGLTTPSYVWGGLVPTLTGMGYRVLTYDHYGRGYSDRPKGLQDRRFFLDHLNELLDDQGVTGDLTVLGYSMGGAIATCFAAENSDRVSQVVLLAPAGIRMPKLGWRAKLGLKPGIGDWLMLLIYGQMHRQGVEAERELPSAVPGIVDLQLKELEYQGFIPATLASYRGIISEDLRPDHLRVADKKLPLLTVLGETDPLIPPAAGPILKDMNPQAQVKVIAGAGHGVPYTHANDVAGYLKDFLKKGAA
jgi:pimeloyl-ACP methyl ester carboxylesterase